MSTDRQIKKKILIVTKHPESKGGVVNYYNHFFKVFRHDHFQLQWFTIGSRPKNYDNRQKRKFSYLVELLKDNLKFIRLLVRDKDIHIVQVSPSLMAVPVLRDNFYLFIARIFRKKTITFFRGWSTDFQDQITTGSSFYLKRVRYFRKSDKILVLASKFKNFLSEIGFDSDKIEVTRTMYVQDDIQNLSPSNSKQIKFLYLGRLSQEKGVLDIIEAVNILNNNEINTDVELYGHFANDEIRVNSKRMIEEYRLINQIKINDFVSGTEKYKALAKADIFLFPTYHDEGCPNSVIEALASGLYIISTPIGAIDEIVVDGENGSILPIKCPEQLAEEIEWCIKNAKKVRSLGELNKTYAINNFEKNIIMKQMNEMYDNL